jgi:hypothetical protein
MTANEIPATGREGELNGDNNDYNNYSEEWKACRDAADKFDSVLFDLRKYGFSILTGLTTAGSFLGFSGPAKVLQIGVIVVTMALIMVLYWLDIYYQSLLYGASFRARFLEIFRLKRALSISIAAFYGASRTGRILHFLYVGFLLGLFILGLFVAGITIGMNDLIILVGAFLAALVGIIIIYFVCDRRRTSTVIEVSKLIKEYRSSRHNPIEVERLEEQMLNLLEKYL